MACCKRELQVACRATAWRDGCCTLRIARCPSEEQAGTKYRKKIDENHTAVSGSNIGGVLNSFISNNPSLGPGFFPDPTELSCQNYVLTGTKVSR
jgi:hypothetical protein